jgi:hypothetical protein
MALMVGFVLAAEYWRRSRRWWVLLLAYLSALILPLSRTVEPSLFLAAAVVVLGVILLANRAERWTIPLLIAGALGLAVSLPVLRALSTATDNYRTESPNEFEVVIDRAREALSVVASEQPLGLLMLAIALGMAGVVAVRIVRGGRPDGWWLLPLLGTPVAYVLLFGLVAEPFVPYFTRYAFFFVLPIASGYALAADLPARQTTVRRLQIAAVCVLVVGVIVLAVPATVRALSTSENPDYRTASRAVAREISRGAEILYEEGTTVEEYRNHYFPGVPRYSPGPVYESYTAARDRHPIGDGPVVVLSQGERIDVDDWSAFSIDDDFVIYSPREDVRWGQRELGEALQSLCRSGDVEDYGYLCIISAQALDAAGDHVSALALLEATEGRARAAGVLEQFAMLLDPLHVLG